MMECRGIRFVVQANTCLFHTHSPLNVLPAVERHVFAKFEFPGLISGDTDIAGVGEALLNLFREKRVRVLSYLKIAELPAALFEPAHDGRDFNDRIPCRKSEYGGGR